MPTLDTLLDCGFKHAAMTGVIPVVTPACLKQASRMGEGLLTLYSHYHLHHYRFVLLMQELSRTLSDCGSRG